MKNTVERLLREEKEKYPQFTKWQLFARVRARIMSEYKQTETAQQLHIALNLIEKEIQF
ncbi:hypothetical protein [Pumilibacter intestinalis]|uniref:hypothetical protein n=1 Tax=Pumilibacter intestinalis TaxID=2941511 RepID=UPI0020403ED6|nr:hypothetical protein [Pumilibacter intestinalis]